MNMAKERFTQSVARRINEESAADAVQRTRRRGAVASLGELTFGLDPRPEAS